MVPTSCNADTLADVLGTRKKEDEETEDGDGEAERS
jgi:hypothetical protein